MGREVGRIWEELREGKYDQNIFYEKFFKKKNVKKDNGNNNNPQPAALSCIICFEKGLIMKRKF